MFWHIPFFNVHKTLSHDQLHFMALGLWAHHIWSQFQKLFNTKADHAIQAAIDEQYVFIYIFIV